MRINIFMLHRNSIILKAPDLSVLWVMVKMRIYFEGLLELFI